MSRAAWARVHTGIGPSFAAMPPNSSRVIRAVDAPNSAARIAAITPAGPAPMTMTSLKGTSLRRDKMTILQVRCSWLGTGLPMKDEDPWLNGKAYLEFLVSPLQQSRLAVLIPHRT